MWSINPARGAGASAVFVRIADAVTGDIRRGVLRAGDRLPSTRSLADELGVNRNTVVAAFDELVAQGWVTSRGSAGTFIAAALPERPVRRTTTAARGIATRLPYELTAVAAPSSAIGPADARFQLSAGIPDPRQFPRAVMARAYRRALRAPSANTTLGYCDPFGSSRLRSAIATMLRTERAIPAAPENILITRGSQMGVDLVARALIRPGDTVAVEELGYQPAWRAFEASGARLAPIALDEAGLVVERFGKLRPRCVYATPHHQYPTTVLMSPARRFALLERARRDRFAIFEDDYDHEFHFAGRPVAPLASTDLDGNVIYAGTLSKTLAPGLRLGFLAAPVAAIATLGAIRASIDRHGDHVLETAVAELLEEGELQRHAHKMRRIYAARRDAFADQLTHQLGGVLSFELPAGGITLWARVADGIDIPRWQQRALARGVAFTSAQAFALDRQPRPFIRLAFARYTESELNEAVRVLRNTVLTRRSLSHLDSL